MSDDPRSDNVADKSGIKKPAPQGVLLEKLGSERLSGPITQEHINEKTHMGANLTADGATFRVWAPNEQIEVYLRISDKHESIAGEEDNWDPIADRHLNRNSDGTWTGFLSGVRDGDYYRFYIANRGAQPYKRDPYARELEFYGFPDCNCIVRDPSSYPWHDQNHRTPALKDLIIYQFHVGRFYAVDENGNDVRDKREGKFLDLLDQIPHLVKLGVNAIEPLPIIEFQGPYSLGYNGTDLFCPEMDYCVQSHELVPYAEKANRLLGDRGCEPLTIRQLESQINQLKAVIDICHVYGISVIFDLVYNHGGGFGDDDQSIYFFDRAYTRDNNDSLYFTDQGYAGGLQFDYDKPQVQQFLVDNALFFVDEYHVDGLRYDDVAAVNTYDSWRVLQKITAAVKNTKPDAVLIAEYWRDDPSPILDEINQWGAGFDAVWYFGLRNAIRNAVEQSARRKDARIYLNAVRAQLLQPAKPSGIWPVVHHLENADLQRLENSDDRQPRLASLADASNPLSWQARSRARVATGILFTAPGIPMLFMGQEILEDKYWSDSPNPNTFIWWDGLKYDVHKQCFFRYTCDLISLRRSYPAFCTQNINVFHVDEGNRVMAYHRWVDKSGGDVVVIVSFNESTLSSYKIGFPLSDYWLEAFNSDIYDHSVEENTDSKTSGVIANGSSMHGLPYSCAIIIPANSVLFFVHDKGKN